jgi:hypothetical protein
MPPTWNRFVPKLPFENAAIGQLSPYLPHLPIAAFPAAERPSTDFVGIQPSARVITFPGYRN